MDKGTKISFIPKKPLVKTGEMRSRPISLALFISLAIFFVTLATYGGLYFYNNTLENGLKEKIKELELEKIKADPSGTIAKAEELQAKIGSVEDLLDRHVSPSSVFNLLQEITLKNITLNSFSIEKTEKGSTSKIVGSAMSSAVNSSGFTVNVKGKASSYSSLAYQSDVLKKEIEEKQRIVSFSVGNISLDESSNVLFSLNIELDPVFLLYDETDIENVKEILTDENIEEDVNTEVIE